VKGGDCLLMDRTRSREAGWCMRLRQSVKGVVDLDSATVSVFMLLMLME